MKFRHVMVWVQILYWLWQSHLILLSDKVLQMEYDMKKIFASVLLLLAPSIGFAGGHAGLGGHGTGVVTNTESMQGKTGGIVKLTNQDVWIWDNPPEGFPAASNATCNQFIAFGETPQPIGGVVVCRSIDPDGDVTLNNGTFQPDGTVLLTIVAATGKWAPYVGASWIGKTDIQVSETASVYSFTPAN